MEDDEDDSVEDEEAFKKRCTVQSYVFVQGLIFGYIKGKHPYGASYDVA